MSFPLVRMRRLRRNPVLREMTAETTLTVNDLIYPMFVCHGKGVKEDVASMPGVARYSVDLLVEECKRIKDLGVPAVILFGIPAKKDALGREGYADNGIIPQAVRAIRKQVPGLLVICDVCMCEYTDHGHCGILDKGEVHNDATLELLAKASLAYAKAGRPHGGPQRHDGRPGDRDQRGPGRGGL
jgi:porphobilinogen synthase